MAAKKVAAQKQPAESLDLRALYHVLREKAWIIALCVLAVGSVTAAYLYRAPRIYVAKVVLQVEQEEQKIINIQSVQKEDLQSVEFLKTVEQTLRQRRFGFGVAADAADVHCVSRAADAGVAAAERLR